jgi:hypothetical protein
MWGTSNVVIDSNGEQFLMESNMPATQGDGFDGVALRVRVSDSSDNGIILENSSEERLLSVRGSDAFTSISGNTVVRKSFTVDSNATVNADLLVVKDTIHNGKIVVMDGAIGSGGLEGRGIYLNTRDDARWGMYLQDGVSLANGTAVNGDGFSSTSARLRLRDDVTMGYVIENSSEERLLSVRANDGYTSINGELRVVGSATFNSTVLFDDDTTHHGKIIVMDNALSGGLQGRGIHLNSASDTTWGLYLHNDVSLNGSTAVNGDGFTSTSARLRVPNNANNGLILENANERRLLSVRGNDGFTSINGELRVVESATFNSTVLFDDDTTHHGKIIVMDNALSGGLQGRGIHLNSASDTTWGLYLHNDVSLNGSTAVNGDGFTSTSTRLRVPNNANNGLILENANERRLLSVRGNDGFTSINGELRVVESATFNSTVLFDDDTTHHGKIIVMDNALSGGLQGRGIHLNSASDTTWGLYLHNDVSLNGSTAVNGEGFTSTSARLRVPNDANNGFILENANERRLLSVRGNDGYTSINGNLQVVDNATFDGNITTAGNLNASGNVTSANVISDGDVTAGNVSLLSVNSRTNNNSDAIEVIDETIRQNIYEFPPATLPLFRTNGTISENDATYGDGYYEYDSTDALGGGYGWFRVFQSKGGLEYRTRDSWDSDGNYTGSASYQGYSGMNAYVTFPDNWPMKLNYFTFTFLRQVKELVVFADGVEIDTYTFESTNNNNVVITATSEITANTFNFVFTKSHGGSQLHIGQLRLHGRLINKFLRVRDLGDILDGAPNDQDIQDLEDDVNNLQAQINSLQIQVNDNETAISDKPGYDVVSSVEENDRSLNVFTRTSPTSSSFRSISLFEATTTDDKYENNFPYGHIIFVYLASNENIELNEKVPDYTATTTAGDVTTFDTPLVINDDDTNGNLNTIYASHQGFSELYGSWNGTTLPGEWRNRGKIPNSRVHLFQKVSQGSFIFF